MREAMKYRFSKGLPSSWRTRKLLSAPRVKQIQKTFYNLKVTLLCGFVTILVLRGTIGAGNFGTPAQDFNEIREFLPHRKEPSRMLTEVKHLKREEKGDEKLDPLFSGSFSHSLGPKIAFWDEQRNQWLEAHTPPAKTKPTILLVTGSQPTPCSNSMGDHHLLKALKNKIDYARLHGMDIFYNIAHLDHLMTGFWAKLPMLQKLMLAHPEADWLWWMDSDALFTDMAFELPMERYENFELVLYGHEEMVYEKKSWDGLNTGSFLLRNSKWGVDFLEEWAAMAPEAVKLLTKRLSGRPEFEAHDQTALLHLLITQSSIWKSKVYFENSFYLHGHWEILVENYEELMEQFHPGYGDQRWPFITHFVGCKPCGGYGGYAMERCTKHMERAFNFADNQILAIYGYHHHSLTSNKVKRIHNDTSTPLENLHLKARTSSLSISKTWTPQPI